MPLALILSRGLAYLRRQALGRIMALEFTEYDSRFEQFMSPLTAVTDALAQQLMVAPDPKNLEMKVCFGAAQGVLLCARQN